MDPNNQRLRLQVLNSTNPSIRVAVAPQSQNISIAPAAQSVQPTINVPQAPANNQAPQSAPAQAPYTPPQQHTGFWGHVGNAVKDIASPFVNVGEDVSNAIGNAEVSVGNALGFKAKTGVQTNQQQFGDINSAVGIKTQNNDLKHFGGNLAQVGLTVAAPFTGGESLAAEAGIDAALGAGFGAANTFTNNDNATVGDYAKSAGLGALFGGAGRVIGAGVGKLTGPLLSKFTGKATADSLSNAVAQEGDAATIQAGLGTTPEISKFLARETDPEVIKNVLNEAGVDTSKSAYQALQEQAAAKKNAADQTQPIDFLDPMNPKQSQLPSGWHPDGAPDPVPVLASQAQKSGTVDEFKAYIDGLKGEDKAAATSALNGMTPEEFYAAAGGGSSKTVAPETGAASLPQEDRAAIQAAGGTIPDTTIHLPSKGVYAKLSPEQAAALADETKNVASNSKDIVHLSAHTPALQRGAKEVSLEDIKAASPNAKSTLDAIAPKDVTATDGTALPAEDLAAIQKAGGEVPKPVAEAVASQAPVDPNVEAARQQVMDTLKGGQPTREYNKAAAARSAEKGSRSAAGDAAYEAAGGGQAGMQAKLAALKGEYTKSGFGIDMSPEHQAALMDHIQANPELKPFEKTNAQIALHKLQNNGTSGPTPYDIGILRKALGNDFGDTVQAAVDDGTTFAQKASHVMGEVAGLPKSIMASFDLSGTLRQGGILGSRFPKEAANAFKEQLKYFGSEDAFKKGMAEIVAAPNFQEKLDAGLAVTGTDVLDKSEEQYVSNLAEKIPGFGKGVAASDRAYTGFLTKLRSDVYDKVTQAAEASGAPMSEADKASLAKFINTASGRGDLGKYLEQHSQTLSTALFSPRLWKSRLDMLNPVYYAKLSGPAQKLALQTAGTFASEAGAVLGLASMIPGVTVETDPRSSDFGKIKWHNTRYDILGGLQQNIVFAYREITGETKSSQTGTITKFGSKFGGPTRLSAASDMIQNKENPLLSAASQILRGKDRGGNPVNPFTTVAQLAVPLPFSGIFQNAQDIGSAKNPADLAKGALMAAPDFIGVSAQTYGSIPTKNQGKPDATGQATYAGKIEPNMVTDFNGKVVLDKNGKPVTVTFPNGASDLTKQSLIDAKRTTAVKDQYLRSLPQQTQELMKLSDSQLKDYVTNGQITQGDFDHIKNVQKTADSVSKGNVYAVPDGANSPEAKQYFQHYNSMDAKDQKAWLDQPADTNSQHITQQVNAQRMKGLDEFKPSNQLASLYANYEKDINTHTTGDGAYHCYRPP